MKAEFPNRFDLALLAGPRTQSFSNRADVFQQLIGDGLLLLMGYQAHVTATKGRDGSIDAWVEAASELSSPFAGIPGPFIVECKDHDDSLPNWSKNVYSSWSKVKEKLTNEASKNWTGLFSPWARAHGYAYCVSAVLNQSVRDGLTEEIHRFFVELPDSQHPPIEKIRVIDWGDLRPWLSAMSRLCDAWLGIGSRAILSHSEYLASLTGFREYLLSANLPFVSPKKTSSTAPEALFQALASDVEKPGTLLVGAGGVGKTRTSLEVARIAEEHGWRTLHILPDEPGITSEDLARAILPGDSATLLIFDYLDQMQRLDLGALRRLVPQAQQRGMRLRFFANSRPGWMHQDNPGRDELFTIIKFLPDSTQQSEIIHTMISSVAPKCLTRLGESELRRICGQRPIIALLIARELERRMHAGTLDSDEFGAVRSGDLLHWLRRRLAEDGMQVEVPASPLQPSRPSGAMVAAAAAFVCAPHSADLLVRAAETAAETHGEPCNGQYLVAALESLGWLVRDIWLSTAHDIVADEVFDRVVREGDFIRKPEFDAILSSWSVSANMVGRLATALKRVIGGIENHTAADRLQDTAAHWLEERAAQVGARLAFGSGDSTSYALGAILEGIPWSAVATRKWDDLVSPWLAVYSTEAGARHLLYRGLSNDETAPKLIVAGLAWLDRFQKELAASFVLHPLLGRSDLGDQAATAIALALAWLKQFPENLEAGFVFPPLLERGDLGDQAPKAIELALAWLKQFLENLEAGFVLSPLLGRGDLDDHASKAIELAMAWLKRFPENLDSQFVFKPLLERGDLGDHAPEAIELALAWLKQFPENLDAQFVFNSLLGRDDLGDHAPKAIELALAWLKRFPENLEAGFVLPRLLERGDLGDQAPQTIELVLVWLKTHSQTKEAEFALKHLLRRPDVTPTQVIDLKRAAIQRLGPRVRDPKDDEVSFLLRWCLQSRVNDPDLDKELLELSVNWLEADRRDSDFVFNRVLRRPDTSEEQWGAAARHASAWLRHTSLDILGRDHAINSLLTRPHLLSDEEMAFVVREAVSWLQKNPGHRESNRLRKNVERIKLRLSPDSPLHQEFDRMPGGPIMS